MGLPILSPCFCKLVSRTSLTWSPQPETPTPSVHPCPHISVHKWETDLFCTSYASNCKNPYIYCICIPSQLLQFSQQLCSRLEQLVLLYASFSFFSLEESDPLRYKPIINHRQNLGRYIYIWRWGFRRNGSLIIIKGRPDLSISRIPQWDISITIIILLRCRFFTMYLFYSISHFYIGQCQINNMKLSVFRYCCPTPFLASASTGLYKRMRWNVERQIEGEGEGQAYDSAEL